MATTVKKTQPKPIRVAPTVTDPGMRNSRGPAEMLLTSETGETPDEQDRDMVFGTSSKTKEEQDTTSESTQTSTMLIIMFALIILALVALIVWMLMKQSNDKKDEDEVRRIIQPTAHPRNNMPPNYGPRHAANGPPGSTNNANMPNGQTNQQSSASTLHADQYNEHVHQRNMQAMHQQQANMQQQMALVNAKLREEDTGSTEELEAVRKQSKEKRAVTFAETMAAVDGKEVAPLKVPLADEEEAPKKAKFSKKNPHPGIMRPGGDHSQSDVDDVLAQTQAALSKKENKVAPELTDLDKALLDKVANSLNKDDESSDESSESEPDDE